MEKRKLTPQELHEIRSKASLSRKRKSGGRQGGRPLGALGEKSEDPLRGMSVRTSSYEVFRRFAFSRNFSIADAMAMIAKTIKDSNPDI